MRRRIQGLIVALVAVASVVGLMIPHTSDPQASAAVGKLGIGTALSAHRPTENTSVPLTTRGIHLGLAFGDTLFWGTPSAVTAAMDDIVDTGAGWARVDLSWADIQGSGPGSFRWSGFDQIVAAARVRNVHILATIAYTPPWARAAGCTTQSCAPVDPAAFATFAKAAVQRYGDYVNTWEIWNEENTPGFWAPTPDPDAYATLLRATTTAIRAVQPKAFIMSGGLAAVVSRDRAVDTRDYLRRLCADGVNQTVDAIAYHPYTYPYLPSYQAPWGTAWNKIDMIQSSLVSILQDAGTPNLPIWLTEYGAPTNGPGTASSGSMPVASSVDHVTPERQAQIASDAVHSAAATPDVSALFWYADKDESGPNNSYYYGLRTADGTPKPAYKAWKDAISALRRG